MTDRAVTTTLEYALSLAIATLVVTGLLVAGADFVSDQRERVVRSELRVVGQQLASDVQRADRLARAGTGADLLTLNASYPDRVAGVGYTVEVIPDAKPVVAGDQRQLALSSHSEDVTVTVRMRVESNLASTSVPGGDVAIVYDATDSPPVLEVVSRD